MLVCGVFIFLMQTGFALLEVGTVRFKNNQNILLKNTMNICVNVLTWWVCGYAIAFGQESPIFGQRFFFSTKMEDKEFIYEYGHWFFQFAVVLACTTIVTGPLAERSQIGCYLIFSMLLCGFIYPIVASSAWVPAGWLVKATWNDGVGYEDYAGSGTVHLVGGTCGVIGAIILGPRVGRFDEEVKELKHGDIEDQGRHSDVYAQVADKYKSGEWNDAKLNAFLRAYDVKRND